MEVMTAIHELQGVLGFFLIPFLFAVAFIAMFISVVIAVLISMFISVLILDSLPFLIGKVRTIIIGVISGKKEKEIIDGKKV